jgi:hypothetical protein
VQWKRIMSSKNVLLCSYAVSPAVAGLTSSGWPGSRVQGAVLLGRLGQLLLLPLAAVPPLITGWHATGTIERPSRRP